MARILFLLFKDMIAAADRHDITFQTYHDNITEAYKKMDVDDQGRFHELVSEFMKEI